MTFLNPAILIGLLAASIPVIIHLLNLKKLKNVDFSTLMFLKELQKNKIRKIKIKQWLLLFLRVLVIIFIVLSFARPTLQGLSIAGVTSAAKTTSVFLIDNTFSMSVVDQQGSFLNQAKKLVENIISRHQDGDEIFISFIAEDSITQLKVNSNDLINTFNSDNISFLKTELKKNLFLSAELVNKSKNFNREIFILSDFQKNMFPNELEKTDLSELLNERVKIYQIPFNKEDVFNLSIDDLKPENQIVQKGSVINFVITVTNHTKQNLQNRVLSLYINNKRVSQKSFNINSNETQKISIETTLNEDGFLEVFAELETDDIIQDNQYFLAMNIPDKISVLVLREETTNPDFLILALRTLPSEKIIIDDFDIQKHPSLNLEKYDLIIINSDYLNNYNSLKNYLEQGGSMMIVPPYNLNIVTFNDLISSLGLGKFDSFITSENRVNIQFDKIDFEHPVFKDLFENNKQRKIESPTINQFLKNSNRLGTDIITTSDNSSFLSERKIGKGKVFLFNSAFNLNWNDFPIKSIFAPLIVKSVLYLSQSDFISSQLLAGDEYFLNLSNINTQKIVFKRPDQTEDFIQMNDLKAQNFHYKKTNLAGIYRVISSDKIISVFAVNHHNSESKQEYFSLDDFRNFLNDLKFSGQLIKIDPNENPIEKINQSRFGTELWKLFVLLAIITAIIEMIISRNNKKEIQSLNETIIQ